jgi:hypothetical protein
MSNRAITATGLLLGAAGAVTGFLLTARAIQNRRYPQPAKPYNQGDSVATSIGRLIAKRKGATA